MSSNSAVREFVQKVPIALKRRFVYSLGVLLLSFAIIYSFSQLSTRYAFGLSIICQTVFFISLLTSTVTKESLLVMRSVGLQLRTSYLLGGEQTKFIPCIGINDVIINEAITMITEEKAGKVLEKLCSKKQHNVVYYLAVLVSSEEDRSKTKEVIPIFMSSRPRLKQLIEIKEDVKKFCGLETDEDFMDGVSLPFERVRKLMYLSLNPSSLEDSLSLEVLGWTKLWL